MGEAIPSCHRNQVIEQAKFTYSKFSKQIDVLKSLENEYRFKYEDEDDEHD